MGHVRGWCESSSESVLEKLTSSLSSVAYVCSADCAGLVVTSSGASDDGILTLTLASNDFWPPLAGNSLLQSVQPIQ
jgi:hypothetical protein